MVRRTRNTRRVAKSEPPWMKKVRQKYKAALDSGHVLTYQEVVDLYKRVTGSASLSMETRRLLREMKNSWLETLAFAVDRSRVPRYITIAPVNFGVYQADSGFFAEKSGRAGYVGFLLLSCNVSGYSLAELLTGKTKKDYLEAFRKMFASGKAKFCHTIQTDKDLSFVNKTVVDQMKTDYGVRLHQLTNNSKCFVVERILGVLKTRISILQMRRRDKEWHSLVKVVLKFFNESKPTGSSFRRVDVNELNYIDFLNEVRKTEDITGEWNTTRISYEDLEVAGWEDSVFKFYLGERVSLVRQQDPMVWYGEKTFQKKSRQGRLGLNIYKVYGAELRTARNSDYVPGK